MMRFLFVILVTLLIVPLLDGCTPSTAGGHRPDLLSDVARDFSALSLNEIVIAPLTATARAASVSTDTLRSLDEELIDTFDRDTSLTVLNHTARARVTQALAAHQTSSAGQSSGSFSGSERSNPIGLAREVGAQGVVTGVLSRFDDLEGSRFGGSQLAGVSFRLALIDAKTGRTLWTASFEHTDEPLSDNLFRLGEKLREGVGFQPAHELVSRGFALAAKDLQAHRTEAELGKSQGRPADNQLRPVQGAHAEQGAK